MAMITTHAVRRYVCVCVCACVTLLVVRAAESQNVLVEVALISTKM